METGSHPYSAFMMMDDFMFRAASTPQGHQVAIVAVNLNFRFHVRSSEGF